MGGDSVLNFSEMRSVKIPESMDEYPEVETPVSNITVLHKDFNWLKLLINKRLEKLKKNEYKGALLNELPPPLNTSVCTFHSWLAIHKASLEERLILTLALADYMMPESLDALSTSDMFYDRPYTHLGLYFDKENQLLQPTWKTAAFLLYGEDLHAQEKLRHKINPNNLLWKEKRLSSTESVSRSVQRHPLHLQPLILSEDSINEWVLDKEQEVLLPKDCPIQKISSRLTWEQLVISDSTGSQLREIKQWINYEAELRSDPILSQIAKPGYRALFYGPSGTGKTLTAALLGKELNRPVYRVDTAKVVSKWIGETEKNLANVFDQAEGKQWILFFDEADALFGKRTAVSDSHDRHANQEVSWLLQRIEAFDGLIILASNYIENMDEAFKRRFQSVISFDLPDSEQRLALWRQSISPNIPLANEINVEDLANSFHLSGASITNIMIKASLAALSLAKHENKPAVISWSCLEKAIKAVQESPIGTISYGTSHPMMRR